jgi:glycerophosphoryl diester phosphodiesterase
MINNKFILAHRGYSDIAPENTQLAFESAFNFGFDGVELDVHKTKDGELVIIHDETTNRTSEKKLSIQNSLYQDLNELDYASKFPISNLPSQQLLTLKKFLDLFINKFSIINIEIKTDEIEYKGIEKDVITLLKKYPLYRNKILISSFNFKSLERVREFDDKILIGFL